MTTVLTIPICWDKTHSTVEQPRKLLGSYALYVREFQLGAQDSVLSW